MGLLSLERVAQLEPGARRYASPLEPAPGRVPFAPTDATPAGPLGRDEEASGAPISLLWQRAAVLGSLWAASEIVLGSFLHNLRVPFAGHFLTAIAIVVLTAGHRTWPERGLLARAGLIAAVMKSASPSAVLFGPMVGIAMEGLAMEAGVRLLGGRLPGYALGGALAMSWTLVHKIGSLLVTYGTGLLPLYRDMVSWAGRQVGSIPLGAWGPLAALALLNVVAGVAASLVGTRLVSGAPRSVPRLARLGAAVADWRRRTDPPGADASRPSTIGLVAWLVSLPAGMVLFTRIPLAARAALAAAAVLAAVLGQPRALRHLRRPGFWFALVGITLLSGALAGALSSRPGATAWTGLEAGVGMSLHAVFVSVSFAALGAELAHPLVRSWAERVGGGEPHRALRAAFSALPLTIAALPSGRELLVSPARSLAGLLPRLDEWLAGLGRTARVAGIVTGERGAGKTTFVADVVGRLRERGFRVDGLLSPGEIRAGERWTIDLVDLSTGDRRRFATRDAAPGWVELGSFRIDPEALHEGARTLAPERVAGADLVVVDEVGPWELSGGGWDAALARLHAAGGPPLLFVVRRSLVDEVLARFSPSGAPVWDVSVDTADRVADALDEGRAEPRPNGIR